MDKIVIYSDRLNKLMVILRFEKDLIIGDWVYIGEL